MRQVALVTRILRTAPQRVKSGDQPIRRGIGHLTDPVCERLLGATMP
tara:strand:+ start:2373 stop:2513 length:141 start_codon:yes stop_codon:yes gene_type:complete